MVEAGTESPPASGAGTPEQTEASETESVARRYFAAINESDLETAVELWEPGGREHVRGQVDATAPEGVRAFLGGMRASLPDLQMEVVETTTEGDRCAVRWRLTATFAGPEPFNGIEPTGARLELEGVDVLTIRAGRIHENNAFTDGMTFARQLGMMPAQGSKGEQRMTGAFNAKTRIGRRLGHAELEAVADDVWVVQGQPARCNVYLIAEEGGVTMFDAGARTMAAAVAGAAARLGGVQRIVLGHGHTDHRGSAPHFDVPILCHPDEVVDAEGSGGFRYWGEGLPKLPPPHRQVHRMLHRFAWDGGPVKISGTLEEGDEVAGFRVIHLPGHAPGLIALWRESDRLALVSDCFYTLDFWGRDMAPQLPVSGYNFDTEQARASLLKLAALEPAAAWPGHAKPVTGDVRRALEHAAATT